MTTAPGARADARAEGYSASHYLGGERFASYAIQEELLRGRGPVLEVGIGPGIVAQRLRDAGTAVTTADLEAELGPDVAASITSLPFADGAFPTVASFQVLEHIPKAVLPQAVGELCRVAGDRVVVSVPRKTDLLKTYVSLYVLGREWGYDEHEWELGLYVTTAAFLRHFWRHGFGLSGYDGTQPWHRFFVFTRDGVGPVRGRLAALRRRWAPAGARP